MLAYSRHSKNIPVYKQTNIKGQEWLLDVDCQNMLFWPRDYFPNIITLCLNDLDKCVHFSM